MPKWGLTRAQRHAQPWGLSEELLRPAKVITDPVHGDIYITELERRLIDSPPLQRLRRVRQLGNTHLVYPAASHSRFSHSLGAMRVAQDLVDAIADNRNGPRHTPDLLDEWANRPTLPTGGNFIDVCLAEATVLARLGGLLHDICHVPLGHTIEDDLKVLTRHDENDARFNQLWGQLDDSSRQAIESGRSIVYPDGLSLVEELQRLILSGRITSDRVSSYPFVADIVGNTICADLIDYLKRDHLFTGLPFAVGDRFLDDFFVVNSKHVHFKKRMAIRISRNSRPRTDIITELVKYLRYRYELTERVLTHHTKVAADAMVGKLLEIWSESVWMSIATEHFPDEASNAEPGNLDQLRQRIHESHPEELLDGTVGAKRYDDGLLAKSKVLSDLDALVETRLEKEFVTRSDDGLLEYLATYGVEEGSTGRDRAIGQLATSVLNRKLFKLIGHAESSADMALADEKYEQFGPPETRQKLERGAANLAELQHGYDVVVWLPNPRMRFKVAGVLVDDGDGIAPLDRVSPAGGQIVEQHKKLWSVGIYADLDVTSPRDADKAEVVLASLKDTIDLRIIRWDGKPALSLSELLIERMSRHVQLSRDSLAKLVQLALAAFDDPGTFRSSLRNLWQAAREEGLISEDPPDDLG